MHEAPSLLHGHLPVQFFLHPQVTVYISDSVTIYLLGINTESTEFSPLGGPMCPHTQKKKKIPQDSNWSLVSISDLNKLKRHNVI